MANRIEELKKDLEILNGLDDYLKDIKTFDVSTQLEDLYDHMAEMQNEIEDLEDLQDDWNDSDDDTDSPGYKLGM